MTSMPASRSARAMTLAPRSWPSSPGFAMTTRILPAIPPIVCRVVPRRGRASGGSILYALSSVTDRTDPYEIIGVRRDASLAEIRISYRRSTQILAPERFANANETVRAEAARRLGALNGAMETIEAERAAESGSALGSLTFGGPAVSPAAEPSLRSIAIVDEPPPLAPPQPRSRGERRGRRRGRGAPDRRRCAVPEPAPDGRRPSPEPSRCRSPRSAEAAPSSSRSRRTRPSKSRRAARASSGARAGRRGSVVEEPEPRRGADGRSRNQSQPRTSRPSRRRHRGRPPARPPARTRPRCR